MLELATSRDTRRLRGGGGFTLIELLVVMVIVALLAAVAVPAIDRASASRAAMAAKLLLHDLTFARQRAVATGTPAWVVFDTDAQTWSVLAEDPESPGRAGASIIADPATGRSFVQALNANEFVGVRISSASFDGNPEIGFDWLGRPLNSSETELAAEGTITLTDNHLLTVAVGTGHVAYLAP